MILAVWGRAGTGKSLLAKELGRHFARSEITAVIDTDMTHPTIPPKMPGITRDDRHSLGGIFASPMIRDASLYLHKAQKTDTLFFAGLTAGDDCMSYEVDIRQHEQARQFITACEEVADVTIVDISGQRDDPFLPAALDMADHFILCLTPDTRNACWYESVRALMERTRTGRDRPLHLVATTVMPHHSVSGFTDLLKIRFTASFPYSRKIAETDLKGDPVAASSGWKKRAWKKQTQRLAALLTMSGHETSRGDKEQPSKGADRWQNPPTTH